MLFGKIRPRHRGLRTSTQCIEGSLKWIKHSNKYLLQRLQKNALSLGTSHAFLLVAAILSAMPFIVVQALLAGELILASLVSLPLHRKRDQLQQFRSILVVAVLLLAFMFFSIPTYGAALEDNARNTIEIGLQGFSRVDTDTTSQATNTRA